MINKMQALRNEFNSLSKVIELKECANCDNTQDLQLHHIVPLGNGGTNKNSNIVCLCSICHSKVHDKNMKNIKELTKIGLVKARARGSTLGRPSKGDKDIDKAIKLYDSKEYSVKEIEDMTGVSKPTLYRYLKERKDK